MSLPNGFVYIKDVIPSIVEDMRYFSSNNFLGRPVTGYERPVAILTEVAAQALVQVEGELNKQGLGLKIFDAYRPQRAVNDFANWAEDDADLLMQAEYYPSFTNKRDIFAAGYIAKYSTHSRGSTVDLTLINLLSQAELDMGGPFDFFGEVSHTAYADISAEARANRDLLVDVMDKYGFDNYIKEWWHFQLRDEPFPNKPDDHFDFLVA